MPPRVAELVALPQRFGDDEDVAEQNRRVEIESANRLQRHFGRQFRRLDQFEEGVFLLERAVFGQGAPRLAHEPDGRTVHRPATAGIQEPLPIRQRAGRGCRVGRVIRFARLNCLAHVCRDQRAVRSAPTMG